MAGIHVPEFSCHTSRLSCVWFSGTRLVGRMTCSVKRFVFIIVVYDGFSMERKTVLACQSSSFMKDQVLAHYKP